jgi:imidazoleglycerol-phosphate dehydratase
MRSAKVSRNTLETRISVELNLDGTGKVKLDTGLPFLEHMLDQIARHGLLDLDITAKGDLHIDAHHTVEDIGISLGQAFAQAIGDKKGLRRYGHAYVPLDEALSRVVLDISGRPGLVFNSSRASSIMPWLRCISTIWRATTLTTRPKPSSRHSAALCALRWNSIRAWSG